MKITESQLRRVIRDVISESNVLVDPNTLRNTLLLVQEALVKELVDTPAGMQFLQKLCDLAESRDEQACKDILMLPRCDEKKFAAIKEICNNPEMLKRGLPVPSDASGYIN